MEITKTSTITSAYDFSLINNLWNGNLPLWAVYWFFMAIAVADNIFAPVIAETLSYNLLMTYVIGMMIFNVLMWKAIWSSASKHTGLAIWRFLARLGVIGGVLKAIGMLLVAFG